MGLNEEEDGKGRCLPWKLVLVEGDDDPQWRGRAAAMRWRGRGTIVPQRGWGRRRTLSNVLRWAEPCGASRRELAFILIPTLSYSFEMFFLRPSQNSSNHLKNSSNHLKMVFLQASPTNIKLKERPRGTCNARHIGLSFQIRLFSISLFVFVNVENNY